MFRSPQLKKGFTLIELIVVIAIIVIITGVLVFNYRGYDYRTTLDGYAQQVDLMLRQAQVYATSVKGFDAHDGRGINYDTAYGVYFTTASGSDNKVTLYAQPYETDVNSSDPGYQPFFGYIPLYCPTGCVPNSIPVEVLSMRPGFKIKSICSTAGCGSQVDNISALYTKDSLAPGLYEAWSSSGQIRARSWAYIEIVLQAPDGKTKSVVAKWSGSSFVK